MNLDILENNKIILGSMSEGRKKLLKEWGLDFEILKANIDEQSIKDDNPTKLVVKIADEKAKALFDYCSLVSILITADTVIWFDNSAIGKPQNKDQALDLFKSYCNNHVTAYTGVVITNKSKDKKTKGFSSTKVYFDEIPLHIIKKLVENNKTYRRAGGFTTNDVFIKPYIKTIEGEEETVIGLPKKLTIDLIKEVL